MPPRRKAAQDEPLARLPAVAPVGVSTPMVAPPATATEERRERELEDLLTEVGTDGRIKVWHIIEGKSAYAGEMTIDGFSLEALIDTFGGGDKSLVFYQGRTKVETVRVPLDPSIPPKNPRGLKPGAAPATAAPGGSMGDFASLITAMATAQMSSMQMFQTMMASSAQTNSEILKGVTMMLTARPEKDPMDVAVKIAELMKVNTATPASELFSVFEKGMNVASKLNGGDDDGTLALAKEGLSIVGKIVENNRPQVGAPSPRRAIGPTQAAGSSGVSSGLNRGNVNVGAGTEGGGGQQGGASGASPVGAGGDGMGNTVRLWAEAARSSMPLLMLAIGNVQPDTAANMVADRLSEEQFADLLDDIEAGTPDEFIARFQSYFDITLPNDDVREWMRQLVASVRALVEDEPLTDSGGGDTSTA